MSSLLEQALEKVTALSTEDQDAIASQILTSLADEDAWKTRFIQKREVIRKWRARPSLRIKEGTRCRWTIFD
jgi:hypothetical protein